MNDTALKTPDILKTRIVNPDLLEQTETTPLFVGQNTHPLTDAEMKRLEGRLDVSERWFRNDASRIKEALFEMAKTPTGREQIREIINAQPLDRKFKINCCLFDWGFEDGVLASYDDFSDVISIPPATMQSSPQELGVSLLHELNHARNIRINSTKLFADAETQAQDVQITLENKNGCPLDWVHVKNYKDNLQRWRLITETGDYPDWANDMKFQYRPSKAEKQTHIYDADREQLAREMYVRQMASLETRAKFMEDFYSSKASLARKEKSSYRFSFFGLGTSYNYREEDERPDEFRAVFEQLNLSSGSGEKYSLETNDEPGISDLVNRNPAVNKLRMLNRSQEIQNEKKFPSENMSSEDVNYSPEENVLIKQKIEKIFAKNNQEPAKIVEGIFDVLVEHRGAYTPELLNEKLFQCILEHQQYHPDLTEGRKRMLKTYEEVTGHSIPISTTDKQNSDLKKKFPNISTPVNVLEEEQDISRILGNNTHGIA